MTAYVLPEVLLGADFTDTGLPLATVGEQHDVWQGGFGAILIQGKGGSSSVDAQRVEPLSITLGHPE